MGGDDVYGKAKGIQFADPYNIKILGKASFISTCPDMCLGSMPKDRKYAMVHENRLEINYPVGMCGVCTCSDKCVNDNILVAYFDRPPTRAGMCCYCIPCTCCGVPVIYTSTPGCLCIDLTPCCGVTVKSAPCSCGRMKVCCCFGTPCYEFCGMNLITSLSKSGADEFIQAFASAVKAYGQRDNGFPADELAIATALSDNVSFLDADKKVTGGAPPSAEDVGIVSETISRTFGNSSKCWAQEVEFIQSD